MCVYNWTLEENTHLFLVLSLITAFCSYCQVFQVSQRFTLIKKKKKKWHSKRCGVICKNVTGTNDEVAQFKIVLLYYNAGE